MKQYNCPDCNVRGDSCDYCQRAQQQINDIRKDYIDIPNSSYVPDCCRYCSNHPSNGGSGICHCVLPYLATTKWTPICTSTYYLL